MAEGNVRSATLDDAPDVARIYNYYIEISIATFEESALSIEEVERRIRETTRSHHWLVFELEGVTRGYAYAGEYHPRDAYRHSVEISVYIENGFTGRRIGQRLYEELFRILEAGDTHAVIGGISLPNDGSVALHERFGMEKVAHFKEVGRKFGEWIDVGYWERIL